MFATGNRGWGGMDEVWQVYALTASGVILGQLAPGPNMLAVSSVALSAGRRQALAVALGVATVVAFWVVLSALGLAAVIAVYPWLLTLMKLVGGCYLLLLAARALAAALRGGAVRLQPSAASAGGWDAFRRGALINATNPKSALMWAAVSTFMFGSGLSWAEVLGFAPIGCLCALAVYGLYATLFSGGLMRRAYARFARAVEALFGAVFGVIGGRLTAAGLGETLR